MYLNDHYWRLNSCYDENQAKLNQTLSEVHSVNLRIRELRGTFKYGQGRKKKDPAYDTKYDKKIREKQHQQAQQGGSGVTLLIDGGDLIQPDSDASDYDENGNKIEPPNQKKDLMTTNTDPIPKSMQQQNQSLNSTSQLQNNQESQSQQLSGDSVQVQDSENGAQQENLNLNSDLNQSPQMPQGYGSVQIGGVAQVAKVSSVASNFKKGGKNSAGKKNHNLNEQTPGAQIQQGQVTQDLNLSQQQNNQTQSTREKIPILVHDRLKAEYERGLLERKLLRNQYFDPMESVQSDEESGYSKSRQDINESTYGSRHELYSDSIYSEKTPTRHNPASALRNHHEANQGQGGFDPTSQLFKDRVEFQDAPYYRNKNEGGYLLGKAREAGAAPEILPENMGVNQLEDESEQTNLNDRTHLGKILRSRDPKKVKIKEINLKQLTSILMDTIVAFQDNRNGESVIGHPVPKLSNVMDQQNLNQSTNLNNSSDNLNVSNLNDNNNLSNQQNLNESQQQPSTIIGGPNLSTSNIIQAENSVISVISPTADTIDQEQPSTRRSRMGSINVGTNLNGPGLLGGLGSEEVYSNNHNNNNTNIGSTSASGHHSAKVPRLSEDDRKTLTKIINSRLRDWSAELGILAIEDLRFHIKD